MTTPIQRNRGLAFVLFLATGGGAGATTLTLTDGLAYFQYNDTSLAGDTFRYDDSGDTLYQEAWYLSLGGQATRLTGGSLSNQTSNSVTITYSSFGGAFSAVESVAVNYTLTDTGSSGILNASLDVAAGSSGATFSLVNYFDYDLGNYTNDSAVFDEATGRMTISDGDSNPGPNVIRQGVFFDSWEIAPYAGLQSRIASGQSLSGTGSPFGPADFTGAMQWDFDLAADETDSVNVGGGGAIGEPGEGLGSGVPEPSTAIPTGLLLGAAFMRRRRR